MLKISSRQSDHCEMFLILFYMWHYKRAVAVDVFVLMETEMIVMIFADASSFAVEHFDGVVVGASHMYGERARGGWHF